MGPQSQPGARMRLPSGVSQEGSHLDAFLWLEGGDVKQTKTFADVEAESLHLGATMLRKWQIKPGDRVMLVYPPSLDFVIAMHACLNAGVVAVPVYPPRPARIVQDVKEFTLLAESAGAVAILTNKAYRLQATMLSYKVSWPSGLPWRVTDISAPQKFSPPPMPERQPGDVAYLQFTSGSTSEPKGVMITYANLHSHVELWGSAMRSSLQRLGPQTRSSAVALNWVPMYHDLGLLTSCFSGFTIGWPTYLMSPLAFMRDPLSLLGAISRYHVTTVTCTDSSYGIMLKRWHAAAPGQRPLLDLSTLALALNCAEPVRASIVREFQQTFLPFGLRPNTVQPAYGLAENVCGVSFSVDEGLVVDEIGGVSCGPPGPGIEVLVVDPATLAVCPEGCVGEVWVDSPSKGAGYWGRPELSEATFRAKLAGAGNQGSSYLRTGDLGYIRTGRLYICGRLKDMLIVGGRNVYPQDIEWSVEERFPQLRKGCSAAFSLPSQHSPDVMDDSQLAYVAEIYESSEEEAALLAAQIAHHIEESFSLSVARLALIKPRTISKTASGKIQRGATRAAMLAGTLQTVPGGSYHKLSRLSRLSFSAPLGSAPGGVEAPAQPDTLEGVFAAYGVTNLEIGVPANGVPSVQLHSLLRDLEAVSGCNLDIELVTQQPAQVVWDLCQRSATVRQCWALVAAAARLSAGGSSQVSSTKAAAAWRRAGCAVLSSKLQEALKRLQSLQGLAAIVQQPPPCVARPSAAARPVDSPLPGTAQLAFQVFGAFFPLLMSAVAVYPAYYFATWARALGSPWSFLWSGSAPRMRFAGLLLPLAVVVSMFSLTLQLIMTKWLLIGRYHPGCWAMWGPFYLRWWLVDRFMAFWETWVGFFMLDTVWLNLFYRIMGADVSLSCSLNKFIREPDLVYIGPGASISGQILCRALLPSKLFMNAVCIGPGCELRDMSILQPGGRLEETAVLDFSAVSPECFLGAAATVYSGNPARASASVPSPGSGASHGSWLLPALKALTVFPIALYLGLFGGSLVVFSWDAVGGIPHFRYGPLLFWASFYFASFGVLGAIGIVAKWLLLGRRSPGIVRSTAWWDWRCFFVNLLSAYYRQQTMILCRATILHNIYLRLLGLRNCIWSSGFANTWAPAAEADLVTVGPAANLNINVIATSKPVDGGSSIEYTQAEIGAGATMGLFSSVGPGPACVGAGAIVGVNSRVVDNVPSWCAVLGNPAFIVGKASSGNSGSKSASGRRSSSSSTNSSFYKGPRNLTSSHNSLALKDLSKDFGEAPYCGHNSDQRGSFSHCSEGAGIPIAMGTCIKLRLLQLVFRVGSLAIVLFLPLLPAYELLVYLFFGTTQFWWDPAAVAPPVTTPVAILLVSVVLAVWLVGTALVYLPMSAAWRRCTLASGVAIDKVHVSSPAFLLYAEIQIVVYGHVKDLALYLIFGSQLMAWYTRALGARVGREACLNLEVYDAHLVTVGDEAVVDAGVLAGHRLERSWLHFGPSHLGPRATLQPMACCMASEVAGAGACLAPLSCCLDRAQVGEEEYWVGVPGRKAIIQDPPEAVQSTNDSLGCHSICIKG